MLIQKLLAFFKFHHVKMIISLVCLPEFACFSFGRGHSKPSRQGGPRRQRVLCHELHGRRVPAQRMSAGPARDLPHPSGRQMCTKRCISSFYRKCTNFRGHNISWVKFSRVLIFVGKSSPP